MIEEFTRRWRALDFGQRRFFSLATALVVGAVAITVAMTAWPQKHTDDPNNPSGIQQVTRTATSAEQQEAERVARRFLTDGGTFGVDAAQLTPANVELALRYAGGDDAVAKTYFTKRQEAYGKVSGLLLIPGPMVIDESTLATWQDPYLEDKLVGFSVADITAVAPPQVTESSANGSTEEYMVVPVSFTSQERTFTQTVDDASWDGTFIVRGASFAEKGLMTLVKSNDTWKVKQLDNIADCFTLATCSTPGDYGTSQEKLTTISTMKATKG